MNWITPACIFLSLSCVLLAIRVLSADRHSSLNISLTLCCGFGAIYELSMGIMFSAKDPRFFNAALMLAASAYLLVSPTILTVLADFGHVQGWKKFAPLIPVTIVILAQLVLVWTDNWIINGFHTTLNGNVYHLANRPLASALTHIQPTINAIVGFYFLILWMASFASPSISPHRDANNRLERPPESLGHVRNGSIVAFAGHARHVLPWGRPGDFRVLVSHNAFSASSRTEARL